jgi:hypothetical protein
MSCVSLRMILFSRFCTRCCSLFTFACTRCVRQFDLQSSRLRGGDALSEASKLGKESAGAAAKFDGAIGSVRIPRYFCSPLFCCSEVALLFTVPFCCCALSDGLQDVSENPLSEWPSCLEHFTQLEFLSLAETNAGNPQNTALSRLTRLRELNLCGSLLSELPPSVACLQLLERLNVSYCKLSTLPRELASLRSLTHLDATFNPLTRQSLLLPLCLSPMRGKLLAVLQADLLNPASPVLTSHALFSEAQSCLPPANSPSSRDWQKVASPADQQELRRQRESIWFLVAAEAISRHLWKLYVKVWLRVICLSEAHYDLPFARSVMSAARSPCQAAFGVETGREISSQRLHRIFQFKLVLTFIALPFFWRSRAFADTPPLLACVCCLSRLPKTYLRSSASERSAA